MRSLETPLAVVLLSFAVLLASPASAQNGTFSNCTGVTGACAALSSVYGSAQLLFPTNANYSIENLHYWDVRDSDLASSCIFLPNTANEVAYAVSLFSKCNAPFAVRGGGHMTVSEFGYLSGDLG
jgi:hypothetical protein